jgi:rfaE bifunctional protein nucleotidyltransferase chain/domain
MGDKVVLAHGVFDLLHVGHVEHLKQAKEMGDKLFVSVVADEFLEPHKKPTIYSEDERMYMLRSLRYVDQVVLCKAPGPQAIIERLRPDIYARGSDYEGVEKPESELLRRLGIAVRYTKSLPIHTKDVIERLSA